MAGVGVGLVLLAIPFQVGYNKHIALAVNIYNNSLKPNAITGVSLEMGITRRG